jgi:catechol 2,3-dioxygenase
METNMTDYKLPANLSVAHVELNVLGLGRMLTFYHDLLGFSVVAEDAYSAQLAPAPGAAPILTLSAPPDLQRQPQFSTGLYHVAYRFPDRRSLATTLLRVAASRWPLQGASDHRVSEAIYFADPEGNGIEIYRDRPRAEWPWHSPEANALGVRDANSTPLQRTIQMGNLPLDLNALIEEADREKADAGGIDLEVVIGHMHLQASNTATAAAFYGDLLGMDVMMEMPAAIFMAAGGYHHHLGANTWHSNGAPQHADDMSGLASYAFELPDAADWLALAERLEQAGQALSKVERAGHPGLWLRDQDGNRVELLTAADQQVAAKVEQLAEAAG